MKPITLKPGPALWVAAALTVAFAASAQTNGVPGPQDFAAFSRFITDRNIFDPNRQPHFYTSTYRPHTTHHTHTSAPGLQLVGTMDYDKGRFAFFNGNSDDLKKVLAVGGTVAGFTVLEILPNQVRLVSADKKGQLTLNVGDGLRQDNGKWVLAETGDYISSASTPDASAAASSSSSTSEESSSEAPASASEPNDVLKRLMQQREKENQ
jgi:hypothetical protein